MHVCFIMCQVFTPRPVSEWRVSGSVDRWAALSDQEHQGIAVYKNDTRDHCAWETDAAARPLSVRCRLLLELLL
jgi:hypothetical protein